MASTTQLIATAEITINGTVLPRFNSIHLNQPFETHHTFEISLSSEMLQKSPTVIRLNELAEKFVGEVITIKFKQGLLSGGAVSSKQAQVFNGIVTSVRMSRSQSNTTSIIISGSSPTILLCAGPTTRSFTKMTIKDIVSKMTDAVGIKSKIAPDDEPIPTIYKVQYEEDDYTFMQRYANTVGEWMYYDGETFFFGNRAYPSLPPIDLNLGTNLFDMEYTLQVTPLNSNWLAHNYQENKPREAKSSAPVEGLQSFAKLAADKSEKLYKNLPTQIDSSQHTSSSLQDIAKRNKAKQANELAVLQGRTPEMEIKVGGLIKVKETVYTSTNATVGAVQSDTTDYGQFIITRLTHNVDNRGVYQATFEAIPYRKGYRPVDYDVPSYTLKQEIAVVKDINDPSGLGRVKVQIYWQKPTNSMTDWIMVSHTMSGKERGVYFIPELDEDVWIEYVAGDPSFPWVVGSYHHPDTKPGKLLFNKDNNFKGIITRSGNHILINDETSKESIKIYNKDEKNIIELTLDGDTTINIKSEGYINLEAKETITMKAKKIEIKAEQDAVLETGSGNLELISGKELMLSSMAKTVIAATSKMAISGAEVAIEADAIAKVEAGAQLTLKGAMVMIN